jgi:hypothetical protein
VCHAVRAQGAKVTRPDAAGVVTELGVRRSTITWPEKFLGSAITDGEEPLWKTWISCALAEVVAPSAIMLNVAATSVLVMRIPLEVRTVAGACPLAADASPGVIDRASRCPAPPPQVAFGREMPCYFERLLNTSATTGPAEKAFGQPA